jgi:hypothetical protein
MESIGTLVNLGTGYSLFSKTRPLKIYAIRLIKGSQRWTGTFKLQEILHQVFYNVSLTKGGTTLLWAKNTANIYRENSNFISPKRQLNCEVVP